MAVENPGRRGSFWVRLTRDRMLHLMVLPSIVVTIVIFYFPMYGIVIAFKDYNIFKGILASPWASSHGFEHFIDFFNAPNSLQIIRNTVVIALLKLGFLSFPPVILALVLNEIRLLSFKKISQTISYLPHFISWVVIGGIMFNVLNTDTGPLNHLLMKAGAISKPIDFLSENSFFWPLVVVSHLWKETGWASIIYLAVISTIDPSLYEAAEMDGAGRLRRMISITWPHLLGIFMVLLVLHAGKIMSGYGQTFEQVYVLGNASNRGVSDILDTYVLRVGLENSRFSYATAINFFKSALNLILLLGANYLSKRATSKGLF